MRKNLLVTFLVAAVASLALAAIPRTRPIPHVSPEDFSNTVTFATTAPPTIGGKNIVTAHTLPDAGVAPLAIETNTVTLSSGTATYTFGTAFSGVPTCICTDTATTAAAANCSGTTATQTVPKGGTSAVINIFCVGPR